ncbi:MAG: hypothetical protein ACRD2T_07310, partial [Thermoanaerobaculia bacterium]
PQRVSLLCHEGARAALFDKMGVPGGERPVQVALGPEHVWVRFESGRLLRLTPAGGKVDVEMRLPEPEERWTAMDVDPADGSIWLASDRLRFVKVSPAGVVSRIPLRGITGTSDFTDLRLAGDSIWVGAVCAGYALLRFDREGRLLGKAFPVEPPPDASEVVRDAAELGCGGAIRMERDAAGRLVAFDAFDRVTYEPDARGEWEVSGSELFTSVPTGYQSVVQGVDVGGAGEQWYVGKFASALFFWKGRPVFLGPAAIGSRASRVLLVPGGGAVRELVESCYGNLIVGVATDATRYAAITERSVVFGDFASAPDLPGSSR